MTVRRLKSYASQTGYVYEYYFAGKRPAIENDPCAPAAEYVFDVSSDRKTVFAVSVFLPALALESCCLELGRTLSDPEEYAGAKLCLLRAFDEIADMARDGRRLTLDSETLRSLLGSIGVD